MKFLCAVVLFSIVAAANAIQFVDCGSKDCKVNSVNVSGCAPDAQTCGFVRGKTVNMTLTFTTLVDDVDDLKYALSGDIRGTWVLFSTTEICDRISSSCPIRHSNTVVTYFLSMSISKLYPTILVPIKSSVSDGKGNICVCFEVQGEIV